MGDRVVLWPKGGRYVSKKDIASASPSCGGVIFRWDDGFQDELPGESGFSAALPKGSSDVPDFVSRYWFKKSCIFSYSLNSCSRFSRIPRQSRVIANNTVGEFCYFAMPFCKSQFNGHSPNRIVLIQTQQTSNPPPYDHNAPSSSGRTNFQSNWNLSGVYEEISAANVWEYYSDGAPEKRYHPSDNPPEITTQQVGVRIVFVDGESRLIPLDSCPANVQVKPENSCPDGTVKEVNCGATTCCYGCQNDRLTLIDSFNKTSS
ncbi:MAG: hypothetical protein AAGG02_18345 [Cyanobacteria bacterium P01_H01_bin.15]